MYCIQRVGTMRCRLCLSKRTKLLFISKNVHGRHILSNDKFRIYECQNCKVAFVDVNVNSEYYSKYYPANYYQDNHNNLLLNKLLYLLKELSFRRRLRLIKKYKPEGNKVLEIGCAKGEFLHRLPSSFQKHGIEINEIGYQYIKEHYQDIEIYNIKIDSDDFDGLSFGEYDIILMWHVFEHVDNPVAFVRSLSKLLSKNGVIILDIPNKNSIGFNLLKHAWFHLDAPRHLFHYAYDNLRSLLQNYDFEIVGCKGNFTDYLHDLSAGFYTRLKTNIFFVNIIIAMVVVPLGFAVRLFASLFVPAVSEVNTYVVKRAL